MPQGTVDNNLVAPVLGQGIPPTHTINVVHLTSIGTTFNVFSYDAVLAENWTNNLPNAGRMRYQLCHRRGLNIE